MTDPIAEARAALDQELAFWHKGDDLPKDRLRKWADRLALAVLEKCQRAAEDDDGDTDRCIASKGKCDCFYGKLRASLEGSHEQAAD